MNGNANRVVVVGDSHAKVFAHPLFAASFPSLEFVLATVAGATVSGFENPNSGTRALSMFKERIEAARAGNALVMLGEVDTGFVIWYRAQKYGVAVEEMLERALDNYRRFLLGLARTMRLVCISTPLPTIRDGEAWGDVANARREVTTLQADRTALTVRFNRAMEAFCLEQGIGYLMLDEASIGPDGLVRPDLCNSDPADHHYDQEAHARMIISGLRSLSRLYPVRHDLYSAPPPEGGVPNNMTSNSQTIVLRDTNQGIDGADPKVEGKRLSGGDEKIASKAEKLARRYAEADAFILSFPKSGRTWMRSVLAHYLSTRFGIPLDIEFGGDDRFLRPCFTHNYFDVYRFVPGEPVLLHEDRLMELPLVLLVRDPRDVCASYYHHIKLRDGKWEGDVYKFARDEVYGIERQARFVHLLFGLYRRHPGPKILLRYEDLRRDPHLGFRQLLALIDRGGVDDTALCQAIESSSFERMQEEEKTMLLEGVAASGHARLGVVNWNGEENALKVRKGKVGSFRKEFGLSNSVKLTLMPETRRLLLKLLVRYGN